MYFAWRPLLARAGRLPHRKVDFRKHLRATGFSEQEIDQHYSEGLDAVNLAMEEATIKFQREAESAYSHGGMSHANAPELLLYNFLADYLNHRNEKVFGKAARIIRKDLDGLDRYGNSLWRDCESCEGKTVWTGQRPELDNQPREICLDRAFELSANAVTNRLFRLFDRSHHGRFERTNYRRRPQNPAVQVSWFDSTLFAYWCGCILLTEWEWQYVLLAGESLDLTNLQRNGFGIWGKPNLWEWFSNGPKKDGHKRRYIRYSKNTYVRLEFDPKRKSQDTAFRVAKAQSRKP